MIAVFCHVSCALLGNLRHRRLPARVINRETFCLEFCQLAECSAHAQAILPLTMSASCAA